MGANILRLLRTHHDLSGRICRGSLPARLPQTVPDTGFVPGGQGVAGSNPAVPTSWQGPLIRVLRPGQRAFCH